MTGALRRTTTTLGAVAMMVLGACGGRPDSDAADTNAAGATATGQGAMDAMPGMQGGGIMAGMQSHMAMMETANGDSLKAMLPMHRQAVGNMLSQMNREMRGMNMSGDAAWTAMVDSVRRDLTSLPELGAARLRDVMPEHRRRVLRLMDMHETMMKAMPM